jgi:hypothetical protein
MRQKVEEQEVGSCSCSGRWQFEKNTKVAVPVKEKNKASVRVISSLREMYREQSRILLIK